VTTPNCQLPRKRTWLSRLLLPLKTTARVSGTIATATTNTTLETGYVAAVAIVRQGRQRVSLDDAIFFRRVSGDHEDSQVPSRVDRACGVAVVATSHLFRLSHPSLGWFSLGSWEMRV
jgi:hypothetical protein